MPAVSPMSAAPTSDTEKKKKKKKKNRNGANLKLRLAYGRRSKNVIRAAVLFSEILRLWLNRNKSCHYLTKPIITRIIVSLVFKNVIIRTAVLFSEIL